MIFLDSFLFWPFWRPMNRSCSANTTNHGLGFIIGDWFDSKSSLIISWSWWNWSGSIQAVSQHLSVAIDLLWLFFFPSLFLPVLSFFLPSPFLLFLPSYLPSYLPSIVPFFLPSFHPSFFLPFLFYFNINFLVSRFLLFCLLDRTSSFNVLLEETWTSFAFSERHSNLVNVIRCSWIWLDNRTLNNNNRYLTEWYLSQLQGIR